jgi:citrate lyase subunit beta/citryl-CoA lyase
MQPRRSVLYMPGANARAMEKAKNLDCDTVIFDLEDAVSPDAKDTARQQVLAAVQNGGYGHRELVVRANGLDTDWGGADVAAFAGAPVAALLFPKIESTAQIAEIADHVNAAGGQHLPIWIMVETPAGVLDLEVFADHPRIEALVMGTSDLVKELRATHETSRQNIAYALQHCVLVARRLGKEIFDGVHLDFQDDVSFREVCANGRAMGFDGKTLIHPTQIIGANEIFGYSEDDVSHAHRLLEVWHTALNEGKGVAVLDGKLVENLHAAEAERVVTFAAAMAARS